MYSDTRLVDSKTDLEEFLTTLKTPWKTMDVDMDTAFSIISSHIQTDVDIEATPLVLFLSIDQERIHIEFPNWQNEVEKSFINQYGLIDGKLIFNKVLMRLFQIAKGTEQQLH